LKEKGAKFRDRVKSARVFKLYMLVKQPVLGVTGAHLDVIGAHGADRPKGRTAQTDRRKVIAA